MIFELLFNLGLVVACLICFINITLVAPAPIQGNMDAAQWPQIIFGLLIACIIANMIKIWRATPKEDRNLGPFKALSFQKILKSKTTWAFVAIFAAIPLLNWIGFILTGLIFCTAFIMLFGERRPLRIILGAVLITVILYTLFINLNIMLPRGVGMFRDFTLWAETLVRF